MKIVCTGDVHLGRPVGSLPAAIRTEEVSAAAGWFDIVNLAIEEQASLLVLTGDVIDEGNKYYEALGALERGIAELAEAGITVAAVAGNHDHDVLPRVARQFDPRRFRLLGAGGEWERLSMPGPGGAAVHIDGWSFPSRHWHDSPLQTYSLDVPEDGVLLGMVHADLNQSGSGYAPVSLDQLRSTGHRLWMLGHIHKPAVFEGTGGFGPAALYPGSPTAFHPGEEGDHGPWIITVTAAGGIETRHVPMSRVRFETLTVDIDGTSELDEIDALIPEAIREHSREILSRRDMRTMPKALIYRLVLTGRTATHTDLQWHVQKVDAYSPGDGPAFIAVDRVTAATTPQWDLDEVARMPGAPGYLARWVRAAGAAAAGEADGAEILTLLERAEKIIGDGPWGPFTELAAGERDPLAGFGSAAEELEHLGLLLLDELLKRKGEEP